MLYKTVFFNILVSEQKKMKKKQKHIVSAAEIILTGQVYIIREFYIIFSYVFM